MSTGHEQRQEEQIRENHAWLMRLVDLVELVIQQCDYETAISLVQVCGDFASRNHPGIFVCHRLEACLRKIGESVPPLLKPDSIETAARSHASEHALHIMTEAHPVGGSTRFLCRWIGNDTSMTHSVAVSAQGTTPLPESLRNAVALSGGAIYRIDEKPRNKLDSAAHLRSIAGKADLILLHIHPHDPLAILALSNWAQRPLTVFMNHADHLFWLGAEIADHYLAFRKTGYDMCLERRDIPAQRCSVLPIPVNNVAVPLSKSKAREKLGIAADTILCITVGFSYKFSAAGDNLHFVEVILPVFRQRQDAVLIAIGPAREGHWVDGYEQTNGRIDAIGEFSDNDLYLAAADIFLMPMPIQSATAALEAGSHGLPILVYADPELYGTVFDSNSPGLIKSVMNTTTTLDYRETLTRLITEQEFRRERGHRTRDTVHQYHGRSAWLGQLEAALEKAGRSPRPNDEKMDGGPLWQVADRQLCEFQRGILGRPTFILARHCESIPLRKKLFIWWKYFQPLKSFVPKYSFIEVILLLLSPARILYLRATFERNRFFRRWFLK